MNIMLVTVAAIVLYLVSGVGLGLRMARGVGALETAKAGLLLAGLGGIALHAWVLYHSVITAAGLNLGFFNASSLVAWIIGLMLVVTAFTKPVENLGALLLPLAALALALAAWFPSSSSVVAMPSWQLRSHILLSVVAYALFSIAAAQALLLAVQENHLRNRHPGGFIRALPPLRTMESLLFQMLGAGFLFLTLALLTGFFFLQDMFAQHLAHKTVLSMLAWCLFGALLWGRQRYGWRGKTAVRWTFGGFALLMLAYFGSKLVLELILGRG